MKRYALACVVGVLAACGEPRRAPATPASSDPDGDRIAGAADLCPNEPEVYNGVDDGDGCPDKPSRRDCISVDALEILDRLYFDPGSAQLPERTDPIIEAVATTIVSNPPIEKVAVVGGREAGEPDALAADRAATVVKGLAARGVPVTRLEPHGHLHAISDAPGKNRAVWFVVLRIDGEDVRPANGTARWTPWQSDCPAQWKARREQGAPIDCNCLDARPPDR